jgi:hypothetical protein
MCVVGNQSSERNKLRLDGIYQTRIFPFQFLFPGKQDQLRLLKEKKQKNQTKQKTTLIADCNRRHITR